MKRHKEILNELIKGKGYYKTFTKNHKETILDDLVNLYLKDLIVFNREYDVLSFGKVANTRLDINGMQSIIKI